MYVKKSNGEQQEVQFDLILKKLKSLKVGLNHVDPIKITKDVIAKMPDAVTTEQLDYYAAEIASSYTSEHYQYSKFAARIYLSRLYKNTPPTFSQAMRMLPINKRIIDAIEEHPDVDSEIDDTCDDNYFYFGLKTLVHNYLQRVNGKIVERPQYLLMRVALAIHGNYTKALESYRLMSKGYFTHASPTMFSAGLVGGQLSSCFLVSLKDDTFNGVFKKLYDCATISNSSGGIGLHMQTLKCGNLAKKLRFFDEMSDMSKLYDSKRPGAIAIYTEPWHGDIEEFINIRRNTGENHLRNLFFGLWVPDLFMRRVEDGTKMWSLMCPSECPGLDKVWGSKFDDLYQKYEREKRFIKQVNARELWTSVMQAQIETGMPYILYKDSCNRKSNHSGLGTLTGSNLCTEILQYTSDDEYAVCNLASIAVNKFVNNGAFDFEEFRRVVEIVTENLNNVIDETVYPVVEAENSNKRHRPIGIGIQGLADLFILLRYPYESEEAQRLNVDIFEHLYYAALNASCKLSKLHGPYESFYSSPSSRGILQCDMWNNVATKIDWTSLRRDIFEHGLYNSLLIAPMPTASTAQILGNNESFEPFTSNSYIRRVNAGEFQVVNRYMVDDLQRIGMWNKSVMKRIELDNGSIANIDGIPQRLKDLYKNVWEISVLCQIKMAADRSPFIDQSQSLNIHMKDVTNMYVMHMKAWKLGLKTGLYYLRTLPIKALVYNNEVCTRDCESCSS